MSERACRFDSDRGYMAIDNKYGKVTFDEPNTIGEDEPVMVFRAADPLLPELLMSYHQLCESQGSPDVHLDLIEVNRSKIVEWQIDHEDQVRTVPTSSHWDGRNRLDGDQK